MWHWETVSVVQKIHRHLKIRLAVKLFKCILLSNGTNEFIIILALWRRVPQLHSPLALAQTIFSKGFGLSWYSSNSWFLSLASAQSLHKGPLQCWAVAKQLTRPCSHLDFSSSFCAQNGTSSTMEEAVSETAAGFVPKKVSDKELWSLLLLTDSLNNLALINLFTLHSASLYCRMCPETQNLDKLLPYTSLHDWIGVR